MPGDRRLGGVEVHRSRTLTPTGRARRHGLAATSVARTILDCAPRLTDGALSRAVNDGIRAGRLTRTELARSLERLPVTTGARRLASHAAADHNPTRSVFEDDFLAFCARFALPTPEVNVRVAGHEADAYFRAERVIVECDGWAFHRDRTAFESDRDRDADALALGIATVRVTRQRLDARPDREADRLDRILANRRRPRAA